MSDPNPYEPPRALEPLTKGQVVKRAIGVGAIILLTPPAMILATATSCVASVYARPPTPFLIPLISLALPFMVVFGLMTWAISVDRQVRGHPDRYSRRAAALATVAPAVGLAQFFSLVLAFGAFVVVNEALGVGIFPGLVVGIAICWVVPMVTLVIMLCRAWWAG